MKKAFWVYFFFLAISMLVLAGCGGEKDTSSESDTEESSDTNETEEPEATNEETEDDKTLTIAMGSDMLTFDIHDHRNVSTEAIHVNMFSYLVRNNEGEISPNLATDWEMIDDETWEFNLREGVKFHNGEDLTSEDVKFTLERVSSDEALKDYPNYKQISEVEIIDDYTFKIHTDGPDPVLLNRISRTGSGMLPKDYIEENGWDHFLENPVGSGPYQYVEWIRDDRVILEVFEDYFDGKIAEWDKLVFRAIPESSTRVAEALTGGVDIANNIAPTDWDRVDENEGTSIIKGPTNRTMMLFVRHNEGYPTSDLRVRQAMDLAIDNQAILDHVMGGAGTPTITRVNPGNFGVHLDLHNTYNYDLEKAKELMIEAGYEDGFEMTLHSPNGRYLQDRETSEVIAGMLSEIGIKVNLEFMEWSSFSEMRDAHAHEDMYLIGLSASQYDANQSLKYYGSAMAEEHIGYKNEEIDELLAKADSNMDPVEREEQYKRVQEIAAEEIPHIMLHQLDAFYAVNDRINFDPPLNELWMVEEITSK